MFFNSLKEMGASSMREPSNLDCFCLKAHAVDLRDQLEGTERCRCARCDIFRMTRSHIIVYVALTITSEDHLEPDL